MPIYTILVHLWIVLNLQIPVPLETGRWTVCLLVVLSRPLCETVTILSPGLSFYS